MNIEGRIVYLNKLIQLAAVDIGWDMALVVEYQADAMLDVGDHLEQLDSGYRKLQCFNLSKQMEQNMVVLSDALPLSLAQFVVSSSNESKQYSQVA